MARERALRCSSPGTSLLVQLVRCMELRKDMAMMWKQHDEFFTLLRRLNLHDDGAGQVRGGPPPLSLGQEYPLPHSEGSDLRRLAVHAREGTASVALFHQMTRMDRRAMLQREHDEAASKADKQGKASEEDKEGESKEDGATAAATAAAGAVGETPAAPIVSEPDPTELGQLSKELARDLDMQDMWPGSPDWQGRRSGMSALSRPGPRLRGHTSRSDVGRILTSLGCYDQCAMLARYMCDETYSLPGGFSNPGDVQVVAAAAWSSALHCGHVSRSAYRDAFTFFSREYKCGGMLQALMKV